MYVKTEIRQGNGSKENIKFSNVWYDKIVFIFYLITDRKGMLFHTSKLYVSNNY